MDVLLRSIAVFIEVLILAAIAYHILNGVRLMIFDMGLKPVYANIIAIVFVAAGFVLVTFFSAHLITFYPPA